jgi:hypothetical protein
MSVLDPVGAAPDARSPHFLLLLFGASAAPIFWLGQLMLSYGLTAYVCYPGDHPHAIARGLTLDGAILTFNLIAVLAAAAGGTAAWRCWRRDPRGARRFLALWGICSSLGFFCAIVFNIIASVMVPPCLT